jgi:hypothetical protein
MKQLIKNLEDYLEVNLSLNSNTVLVDDPSLEKKLNNLFDLVQITFKGKNSPYDRFVKDALSTIILKRAFNNDFFDVFKSDKEPSTFKTYILELAKQNTFTYGTVLKGNAVSFVTDLLSQNHALNYTHNIVDSFVKVTGGGAKARKADKLFATVIDTFTKDDVRQLVGCDTKAITLGKIFEGLEGREYEFLKNSAYAIQYQNLPYIIQKHLYDRKLKAKSIFSRKEVEIFERFKNT